LPFEVVEGGYCQSGQIMSTSALLASKPHPTESDIDDAMSGNICRCGTYVRVREAIKHAAKLPRPGRGLTTIFDRLGWAASRQLGIRTRYARRGSPCAKPVFIRIGREAAT
jgi:xanthine dehydrogenase iron-sulfur cluster and FAD-binding subunit A